MQLSTWLDQEKGRTAALAEHFQITLSAVTQWRTNGVPKERMKEVRDFSCNQITLEEMLPDAQEA